MRLPVTHSLHRVNNIQSTNVAPLLARNSFMLVLLLLTLIYCVSSHAESITVTADPAWFKTSLAKADKLNDKDPVLALNFTQKLFIEHKHELSVSAKLSLIARLAEYQNYLGNLEVTQQYINQFYALEPDLMSADGISLLVTHGALLDELGKPKAAMTKYLHAESNAKATENKKLLGVAYSAIGNSYSMSSNDTEGLKYYHQAYLLISETGDGLELAYLKIQMSRAYSNIYDDEKAINLAKEAISYFNQHEHYFDELYAHNNQARNYMAVKDYHNAINAYQRIIELSQQVEKQSLIEFAYIGLARAYHEQKQNNKARHYFSLYQAVSYRH